MPFKKTYSVLQLLFSQYVKELGPQPRREKTLQMIWNRTKFLPPLRLHLFNLRTICQFDSWSFKIVEDIGVEPMTLCVQGRCSSQLS